MASCGQSRCPLDGFPRAGYREIGDHFLGSVFWRRRIRGASHGGLGYFPHCEDEAGRSP